MVVVLSLDLYQDEGYLRESMLADSLKQDFDNNMLKKDNSEYCQSPSVTGGSCC